jgi:hypothetical protein
MPPPHIARDTAKRILEINPSHRLIERLAASVGEAGASDALSEYAWLLLDQARIVEGESVADPPASARRLPAARTGPAGGLGRRRPFAEQPEGSGLNPRRRF